MNRTKLLQFLLAAMLLESAPSRPLSGVWIRFNPSGLDSIEFRHFNFLASGTLRVRKIEFEGADPPPSSVPAIRVNRFLQRVDQRYSWGSVRTDYQTHLDRLLIRVTVQNKTAGTIKGIWIEPFSLQFPQPPAEYDGNTPMLTHSFGQPAIVKASYGSGTLLIASEDGAKPIQIGLPWTSNRPVNTIFPVSVNTDRVPAFGDGMPLVRRPIAPRSEETFRFSIRFGREGAGIDSLARDVVDRFVVENPPVLRWKDRRPIGALFLATANAGWPGNPRGWLQDPNLDVRSAAGIAKLKERIFSYARNSIEILKSMNAQGMITWDIEGQEFPHAASYVGDPRLFDTMAPEMRGIASDYFRMFREAGFRVGVCIRPQRADFRNGFHQEWVDDPTELLAQKIQWAREHFGATLFYIDSNVTSYDLTPIDNRVFARLHDRFPDCLLIPEHARTAYYASSAPYKELRQGYAGTSAEIRSIYPLAFTVIYTADGAIAARRTDLADSVRRGDVLMFRAWFNDPQNAQVMSVYAAASSQ